MANTFTKSYFHIVFAVKNRDALISKIWKNELEKYITAVIQNRMHKLIAIGSASDHIHILIGYNQNQLIPNLVEIIKTSSNRWIRENRLSKFRFEWQIGYGLFTVSHSQLDGIVKYILSQEEHHKKISFRKEFIDILHNNGVEFKTEYLFDFFDTN